MGLFQEQKVQGFTMIVAIIHADSVHLSILGHVTFREKINHDPPNQDRTGIGARRDRKTTGGQMKREPLKIGDRVRVFSHYGPYIGTIEAIGVVGNTPNGHVKGMVRVKNSDGDEWLQHPRQCVRLRKKSCPPQGKRVEHWAEVDSKGRGVAYYHGGDAERICREDCKTQSNRVVHLVEMKPGEVILDPNKVFLEITGKLAFAHSSLGAEVVRRALEGSAK